MSVISSAPASREFSMSSLTTDSGRFTTSPAAILLDKFGGNIFIFLLRNRYINFQKAHLQKLQGQKLAGHQFFHQHQQNERE